MAALHLLGRRLSVDIPGVMQLAGLGTTARLLAHRGDELTRMVGAVLPLFIRAYESSFDRSDPTSGAAGERPKEAVHV
jgi:hypothetical protein